MILRSASRRIITYVMLISAKLCGGSLDHKNSEIARVLHRPIRALTFPEASTMGIFFALAVPLEAPRNSVSLSYFFEAGYSLPPNTTLFEPWNERKKRKKRSIDRRLIYKTVENKFESTFCKHADIFEFNLKELTIDHRSTLNLLSISSGLPGRECLLRSICETSEYPLHDNGVLGDILHVIFSPSTSRDEDLPQDIVHAELVGRVNNCSKYHADCPVGLFDLIGVLA